MLGLLLRTTLRHVVETRSFGRSSIVEAFMYDGIGTACGALAVTAVAIIDNIIGSINPESKYLAILNLGVPFETVIPIILVNRLILNLQTSYDHDRTAQNSDTHIFSMPEFAPISHPGATLNSTRWDNQCDGPVNQVSGTLRVPP
ncbi:uncharacterized protein STEHIDRAFT_152492 [Stereum hirsutum FP-91666 SS1]|uniref:uncharacterized protein n=1 Tax=Stereum hirsutum (strain FP-91666) TaxID=721885 RepID=UPI000440D2FA|nr:uncharacterized protein STEHIDRAFT_152492 [Stereum hirsutum FP-91666 SS1]EIM90796.1 hypothetical protein STEHIDRAFT_152492 [Stereum hirsutum FP-91666 SS1]